jgi:hypothetical protein
MTDITKYNNGFPLQLSLIEEPKEIDSVNERQFLTTRELAQRWKISHRTLERQRFEKVGASFYKIHGLIRYDLNDVIKYELNNFFSDIGAVNG